MKSADMLLHAAISVRETRRAGPTGTLGQQKNVVAGEIILQSAMMTIDVENNILDIFARF